MFNPVSLASNNATISSFPSKKRRVERQHLTSLPQTIVLFMNTFLSGEEIARLSATNRSWSEKPHREGIRNLLRSILRNDLGYMAAIFPDNERAKLASDFETVELSNYSRLLTRVSAIGLHCLMRGGTFEQSHPTLLLSSLNRAADTLENLKQAQATANWDAISNTCALLEKGQHYMEAVEVARMIRSPDRELEVMKRISWAAYQVYDISRSEEDGKVLVQVLDAMPKIFYFWMEEMNIISQLNANGMNPLAREISSRKPAYLALLYESQFS